MPHPTATRSAEMFRALATISAATKLAMMLRPTRPKGCHGEFSQPAASRQGYSVADLLHPGHQGQGDEGSP